MSLKPAPLPTALACIKPWVLDLLASSLYQGHQELGILRKITLVPVFKELTFQYRGREVKENSELIDTVLSFMELAVWKRKRC